jgi:hypothetical protein
MSAPGRFIAWCKQEQASLQQQLALMTQRNVLTGENRGTGWIDTTSASVARIKARLADLNSLLTETGAATVSKPGREDDTRPDSTIKKVEAGSSPRGEMGQKYLVAGKRVSMRLWTHEPGGKLKSPTKRDYETVGYVISGKAELQLGSFQRERHTITRSWNHSPQSKRRHPRLRFTGAIPLLPPLPL